MNHSSIIHPKNMRTDSQEMGLDGKLTFENYVVNSSNRTAHESARLISRQSEKGNSLFLYGDTGLGKTHLLNAIGNNTADRARYVTSEHFNRECTAAEQSDDPDDLIRFRQKYLNLDVLLFDDIQSLSRRLAVVKEFYTIRRMLQRDGKRIVVTANARINTLDNLDACTQNWLARGISAKLSQPELMTRTTILLNLANQFEAEIPDDAFLYIADLYPRNIRTMKSAMIRMLTTEARKWPAIITRAGQSIFRRPQVNHDRSQPVFSKESSRYNRITNRQHRNHRQRRPHHHCHRSATMKTNRMHEPQLSDRRTCGVIPLVPIQKGWCNHITRLHQP